MRVLFATCGPYFPQHFGGIEANLDNVCSGLVSRSHEVAVVAALARGGWITLRNRAVVRLFGLENSGQWFRGYHVFRDWNLATAVPAIIEAFRPDIVVGNGGGEPDVLFQFDTGKMPTVFHAHGIPPLLRIRNVYDRGVRKYIFCSQFIRERALLSLPRDPDLVTSVIYNAFNPDQYWSSGTGKHVTFINPVAEKGLEIAEAIARALPHTPFLFVKGWPISPAIVARIKLIPNVTLSESVIDMRTIYRRTRILIVPSQVEEGAGRVITEAQINGIPVIASDIGGIPEVIGSGGILVDPREIGAWVKAVRSLLDDEIAWRELSERAQLHVRSKVFSYGQILDKYERFLKNVAIGSSATTALELPSSMS